MKTRVLSALAAALFLPAALAAANAPAQAPSVRLKGKVIDWNEAALPLEKRLADIRASFRGSNQGDLYFTAYLFPGLRGFRHGADGKRGPFRVEVEGEDIRFRGREHSHNFETDSRTGPVGALWLNTLSGTKPGVRSVSLLDPEAVYEFNSIPVYWLGPVEAEASFALAERLFEGGGQELQKNLTFLISQHNTPRVFEFLKKTALADTYGPEVRKSAVFWAGCTQGPRAIDIVREVLRATGEEELQEHAVFALTLIDSREAASELIRIAKTDSESGVRRQAIFWLGQKASQESAKALKDVVDKPDEDLELKESAVFAISQLPRDKSVPMLLAIARDNRSPSVRKRAIFWLGQSGDPQALRFFEDILLKDR